MTLEEVVAKYVERFEYVEPYAEALSRLDRGRKGRRFSLSDLKWTRGLCAWCGSSEIKGRRKYCTEDCVKSAMIYCNPQSPEAKAWRLIFFQAGCCVECGELYEYELKVKILKKAVHLAEMRKKYHRDLSSIPERVTYYQIGYGTGDVWQVDHIVPIFKGGDGIGLDNVQVICVPCHKLKTIMERR